MLDRLSTVATFQDPVAAALARNYLQSHGISACLIDETTIATDWMISNAIGGIKLQVSCLQFERAELLLAQVRAEREEADAQEEPEQTGIATEEIAEELRAEAEDKEPINLLADRLYRSTVFGLIFWPLQFYSLYLLLAVYAEKGKVSPRRRWKVWVSIPLNLFLMSAIGLPLLWLCNHWPGDVAGPDNPVWRRYWMDDFGFTATFPHTPEHHQGPTVGRFGEAQTLTWTAWAHQRAYRVLIDRYPQLPDKTKEQLLQAATLERLAGLGRMVRAEPIDDRGFQGREYRIDFGDYRERGRWFLRGRNLVLLYVQGSPAEVESEEAEQFFTSFRFR